MKRASRRLGPGANAPTRRETGGSHAQTALTDTPAIYTSQGVCDITSIKHACARRRPGSSVVSSAPSLNMLRAAAAAAAVKDLSADKVPEIKPSAAKASEGGR